MSPDHQWSKECILNSRPGFPTSGPASTVHAVAGEAAPTGWNMGKAIVVAGIVSNPTTRRLMNRVRMSILSEPLAPARAKYHDRARHEMSCPAPGRRRELPLGPMRGPTVQVTGSVIATIEMSVGLNIGCPTRTCGRVDSSSASDCRSGSWSKISDKSAEIRDGRAEAG
jgi:hypothetical protein